MLHTLHTYWPYLLPPLLGALIGYVTNYIAIRMLFRPLRPWYIVGVRIPLTPGIIPSQRHELAYKMGEMVGSHLLTSNDVATALEKPLFHQKLQLAVSDKLDHFMGQSLGPAISLLPQRFHNRFYDLIDVLRWKFIKSIRTYLAAPAFEKQLNQFCFSQLNQFLHNDLACFLTPERYQQSRKHIEQRLQQWLSSDNVAQNVAAFIDNQSEQLIRSNKSLKQLLPQDLQNVLIAQLEQEIPQLLNHFSTTLDDLQLRENMEEKVRQGIDSFIDSIEGLSAIITAFFDMEKVYTRLPEFMDKASDELRVWLRSEKVHQDVAGALRERLEHWLDQPLSSYLEQMPYEKVAGMKRFLREHGVNFVQSDTARQHMIEWLERSVDSIKDRPFSDLVAQIGSENSAEKIAGQISTTLLQLLQSESLQQALDRELQQKINYWITQRPLGELATRLPSDARDDLHHGLFEQLISLLKKEIPPLVNTLDIQRIVEEKVNSLDLLQVEDLLMGIMKEQFKYINIFGALLGMLIGLLNLLLLT
ncbi:MAG: DUF445 family protein [Thermodesulfobacteriota bacterium]|nr:DUF445 family protein [Thermodesulfobacteriota bacterium]